ncbi:MAG: DNA cytosine methyltransferase [Oscillospiraceae bacterium]|jgi:DNA (cytosine-5)-methyltransferase 1|nr:DNA cytosine methyltransferase [Oscillospiraceae bacterium]
MYSVIDLFAGAGGLSLGFLQTRKYVIKAAFENNPYMQETYRRNHEGVDVQGDVCSVDYREIQAKYGPIDVVIGGPPCQGFSNANRQKNHAVNQNNMLVKQYIRAILELQPKAFVMENVSMLRSDIHRFYRSEQDDERVNQYQIPREKSRIVLLEKQYMFETALEIVKDESKIREYIWPEEQYTVLNIIYKSRRNIKKMEASLDKYKRRLIKFASEYKEKELDDNYILEQSRRAFNAVMQYYSGELELEKLTESIELAVMLQRMLSKAAEIYSNQLIVDQFDASADLSVIVQSFAVFDYLRAILGSDYDIDAKTLCAADYGAPQKRMRFIVMGVKKTITKKVKLPEGSFAEENYRTVRDAIADLEEVPPFVNMGDDVGIPLESCGVISELGGMLRDTKILKNHIVTATGEIAMRRFRMLHQGQNFHALDAALKENTYTDITRTQNTIYLRLNYDEPSGTVVNVRKSMWIHPVCDRAVSIREAARLQTFPDSFIFYGTKDSQYQQVGNAVPPIMAKSIAKKLAKILREAM